MITRNHLINLEAGLRTLLQAVAEMRASLPMAEHCLTYECIALTVADAYGFAPFVLKSSGKTARVAEARHVAMFLCREMTGASLMEIGKFFERDHGTVIHAGKRVSGQMETDAKFRAKVESLRSRIQQMKEAA